MLELLLQRHAGIDDLVRGKIEIGDDFTSFEELNELIFVWKMT